MLFAGLVAVYHAVVLAQLNRGGAWEKALSDAAEISIQGFFIISGALVLGSLVRSESLGRYAEKRFRRLYPAYAVVILIPAVIALILSGKLAHIMAYLAVNLTFLNFLKPALPDFFSNYNGVVNGALWTLKIEVMFYMVLPIIWWVMKRLPKYQLPLIALMIIGGEVWRYVFDNHFDHNHAYQIARQLPGQMAYFASGMYLWMNWDKVKSLSTIWGLIGLTGVAATLMMPHFAFLRAPFLALFIAWLAFSKGPSLNAARFGDMSYGVYITHFPIIQACIAAGLFASPIIGLAVSISLTFIASFALWHLIEKRALLPSSHYRKAS